MPRLLLFKNWAYRIRGCYAMNCREVIRMGKEVKVIGKKLSELSRSKKEIILGSWIARDSQNTIVDLDDDILFLLNKLAGSRKKLRVVKINNPQDIKEAIETSRYSRYYKK